MKAQVKSFKHVFGWVRIWENMGWVRIWENMDQN